MKIAVQVLTIVVVICAGQLIAQAPADLARVVRERDQAVFRPDAATWDRLTTDDFTVVQENGHLLTKAERLAEIKTHRPLPLPPTGCREKELVRVYGNAAVRRCLADDQWDIEVWVKSARGWQVAAVQVTSVTK
jgi:hypothetical protein